MNNKELRMCVCVYAYMRICVYAYAYLRIRCVCDGLLFLSGTVAHIREYPPGDYSQY